MRSAIGSAAFCLAIAAAACGGGSGQPDRGAQPLIVRKDNVTDVLLPALKDLATPAWQAVEESSTRGPTPVDLFQVTAARFLADLTLAVGNAGSHEILVLGQHGIERRIGGRKSTLP